MCRCFPFTWLNVLTKLVIQMCVLALDLTAEDMLNGWFPRVLSVKEAAILPDSHFSRLKPEIAKAHQGVLSVLYQVSSESHLNYVWPQPVISQMDQMSQLEGSPKGCFGSSKSAAAHWHLVVTGWKCRRWCMNVCTKHVNLAQWSHFKASFKGL